MSLNRFAKRRDTNEREIVVALRKAGCDVQRRDDYDLNVVRSGREYRLEVKTPMGPLTKRQVAMLRRGEGIVIVRTVTEAFQAVGLLPKEAA